jgi:NAD-dependent SIR2 family protein deacetylase
MLHCARTGRHGPRIKRRRAPPKRARLASPSSQAPQPRPLAPAPQELFPGGYAPTPAHFLLRLLSERGLLLRVFTQNIDGLEQLAGVPADRVVAAHGSFDCRWPRSITAFAIEYACFMR